MEMCAAQDLHQPERTPAEPTAAGAGEPSAAARELPWVRDGQLTYRTLVGQRMLRVGTSAWFDWLKRADALQVEHRAGSFVLRRERAGNGRGRRYWRAHRRAGGVRRRVYVGPDRQLTWPRMKRLGAELAGAGADRPHPGGTVPHDDPPSVPAPRSRPRSDRTLEPGGGRPVADRTTVASGHRQVADWYLEHGLPREAVDALFAAGAGNEAMALVRWLAETDGTIWSDIPTVDRWLRELPGSVVDDDPVLSLLREWLYAQYQLIPAPPIRQPAKPRSGGGSSVRGVGAAVRCFGATGNGYADETLDIARASLSELPAEQWMLRTVAAVRCLDPLGHGLRPELVDLTAREFGRLTARCPDLPIRLTAQLGLAVLDALRGRLAGSLAHCVRSAQTAAGAGIAVADYLPAEAQRALCLLERGDLAEASTALDAAAETAVGHPDVGLAIQLCRVRADLCGATGNVSGAVAALDELDDAVMHTPGLAGSPFESVARRSTAARRARIRLLAGDPDSARHLAAGGGTPAPAGLALYELLVRAHLALVVGDPAAALVLAATAHRDHGAVVDTACWLRLRLIAAIAHHRLGRPDEAAERLASAVSLGLPGGYRLPWLELVPDLTGVLESVPRSDLLRHRVSALLGSADPPSDALTARELDVLRAFAAGMSSAETAAWLVISVATVRTHSRSIHRKLRVRTRAQAVEHAYRDGLLRG